MDALGSVENVECQMENVVATNENNITPHKTSFLALVLNQCKKLWLQINHSAKLDLKFIFSLFARLVLFYLRLSGPHFPK